MNLTGGQKQLARPITLPAAIGGINATASLVLMQPQECIYSFNLQPREFGQEIREGYVEWANGWTGGAAETVIPYDGSLETLDRLFVANDEGIWDVSTNGEIAPVQVVVFVDTATGAGRCSWVHYVNDNGDHFMAICDERNGYYTYQETGEIWTKVIQGIAAGEIDDPADPGNPDTNPEQFAFVTIFKNRLWFLRRNSTASCYLNVGSLYGEATPFNFGTQFKHGGTASALYNWSLDGGDGLDDYFVATSTAGDVAIYRGTDPDTDFLLVGLWYIGRLCAGRRGGVEFGGEVYLLSVYGLQPVSGLLNGSAINDPNTYLTRKVAPYLRVLIRETITQFGWGCYVEPILGSISIGTPAREGRGAQQYVFNTGTQAWGINRDIEMAHSANYKGVVFFTDYVKNKIYYVAGSVDDVFLDPSADGVAQTIKFSSLSSYQDYGNAAVYKRCQFIRPMWTGVAIPAYNVEARFDFDLSEIQSLPASIGDLDVSLWEEAFWDVGKWGGSLQTQDNPRGATGLGRHIAIAVNGQGSSAATLIAHDVIIDEGGLM